MICCCQPDPDLFTPVECPPSCLVAWALDQPKEPPIDHA